MTLRLPSWLRHGRQARLAEPTAPATLALYNTHDARNVFSHLLQRVRRGETIVIAHAGRPVAKLMPYRDPEATRPGFLRLHVLINDALADEAEAATPTRSSPEAST